MLKKRQGVGGDGPGDFEIGDFGTMSQYPHVVDFMRQLAWEDGSRRLAGTILLTVEDGRWKAWLHDNDSKASSWLSGDTLAALFESMEDMLLSGAGEWRKDRPKAVGGRR